MRYLIFAFVSFAVLAQDNTQTVDTKSLAPLSFFLKHVDCNRGILGYDLIRDWAGQTGHVRTIDKLNADGSPQLYIFDGTNPVNSPTEYSNFLTLNSASANGWVLSDVTRTITTLPLGTLDLLNYPEYTGIAAIPNASPGTRYEPPAVLYTPVRGFVGKDIAVVTFTSNGNVVATTTITFNVLNTPPVISVAASPDLISVGTSTSFSAVTSDAEGHVVSVSYDYGDGTTGIQASHVYSTPGAYTVKAFANDGYDTTQTQTTVNVVSAEHIPVARITTSDIVAFVNIPFVLDGITSTDQENSIVSFSWDFGDATVFGSAATLSHIYKNTGYVTITLTVTDAEGLKSTISRSIEVLPESDASKFDSAVKTTATFYPHKVNKDVLTIFARVNIGESTLAKGSSIAINYASKRFEATLDKRLRATGWTIKQNLRRQAPGTVEITLKLRSLALSDAFTALGAEDDASISIPIKIELDQKTIDIEVPTDFEFNSSGTRGKALGEF